MNASERIFVALDSPDRERVRELVGALRGEVGGFKVGLESFITFGPSIVEEVLESGAELFVDLKLHDIPNTVAGAAAAIARLGVSYFTVHAGGGVEMIRRGVESAAEAAASAGLPCPTVLAVTVLTSHDDDELKRIGLAGPCSDAVLRLAGVAREAGAGGVVCSPLEIAAVREVFPAAVLMVPGIRPAGAGPSGDDQSRTSGPGEAVTRGADRLVIGRPITRAPDPAAAARRIAEQIRAAGAA